MEALSISLQNSMTILGVPGNRFTHGKDGFAIRLSGNRVAVERTKGDKTRYGVLLFGCTFVELTQSIQDVEKPKKCPRQPMMAMENPGPGDEDHLPKSLRALIPEGCKVLELEDGTFAANDPRYRGRIPKREKVIALRKAYVSDDRKPFIGMGEYMADLAARYGVTLKTAWVCVQGV